MSLPVALIVEDDRTLGQVFDHTLRSINYQTKVITNGREALDHLQTEKPHLILLDLHLPQVSGAEILAYIRSDERLKDVIVMICSADSTMADHLPHKVNVILNKPISVFQLQHLAKRFHPAHQ